MSECELTLDAEQDLLEIAIYTIKTWGLEQADVYESALVGCFQAIGRGEARTSTPLPHRPNLQVARCPHHYVFSLHEEDTPPLMVAILHEKMDLMARLRERLDTEQWVADRPQPPRRAPAPSSVTQVPRRTPLLRAGYP